ncbi:hypothetical protein [Nannocystis bainbridge]|uniref:P/Homo B domain-containing protein n=1 Tax=Nannocystis bainbridge TaxID=2995303 RepID=A0ABT5E5X9_9BACT|nr:hypothetical protein [Nannocystis bainbridge]MDC0721259.1 hypothetical protein [Nannocystis bainbridge]
MHRGLLAWTLACAGGCGDDGGGSTGDGSTTEPATSAATDESTGAPGTTTDGTTGTSTTGEDPTTTGEPETGSTTEAPIDGSGLNCMTPATPIPNPVPPEILPTSFTFDFAESGTVGDINVKLRTSELKRASYVEIRLTHGETTVVLSKDNCEENKDFSVVFDDEAGPFTCCGDIFCSGDPLVGDFQPTEPLAAFAGQPIAGTWTLDIYPFTWSPDLPYQGIVEEFCLDISLP